MAPLFLALYLYALGTGLVKPNVVSIGGDQFDDSSPKEKKQSVGFFVWLYFSLNAGLIFCFSLDVYLQDNVTKHRTWGYAFLLISYSVCFVFFVLGLPRFRLKLPAGSFLTRAAQVLVATFRKWNLPLSEDPKELYNPVRTGKSIVRLKHTSNLR
jgi:peptide/histidine transporter 3/4